MRLDDGQAVVGVDGRWVTLAQGCGQATVEGRVVAGIGGHGLLLAGAAENAPLLAGPLPEAGVGG